MPDELPQDQTPTTDELRVSPLDQRQVARFQTTGPKILKQAQNHEIVTTEDYDASAALLDVIVAGQKNIEGVFEKPVKEANNVHKFLTGLRNMLTQPYVQAEELLKRRRRDWRNEEERKRQAAEEEARRKAREELEAQAVEEASELTASGEHEAASIVIDRAVNAPPPPVIVPSTVPKQKGHSITKVWKFRIKNPDLIKREFITPKDPFDPEEYPKIKTLVSRLGPDAASIVGGVEIYPDEKESIRGVK